MLLWTLLQGNPALACRYTVRDIGFIDLETEPYRFYVFVRASTPPEVVKLLETEAASAFRDSNVLVEIVNADAPKPHPGLKFLPATAAGSAPTAVLVSPDGQALTCPLAEPGQPFNETLSAALERAVTSPTREAIVQAVSEAFAAVLFIEGDNRAENDRARQSILKTIAEPPILIQLDAAGLARERVLLWSLGLDAQPSSEPRAAVFFGKARWIGPLMRGAEITERNLRGILSIIGADCECTLDISWTQGTRLPVRWNRALAARLVTTLGFDPESPTVKMEARRILGRPATGANGSDAPSITALAGGLVPVADIVTISGRSEGAASAATAEPPESNAAMRKRPPGMPAAILFLAGLAILIVVAGVGHLLWASRKGKPPP